MLHDAQRLAIVLVAAGASGYRSATSCSAESSALSPVWPKGVWQVVAERDGLSQVLDERECARDRTRDLRDLERVSEAGPVVVALGREEDLRFVGQAPERLAVDDLSRSRWKSVRYRSGSTRPIAAACLGRLRGSRRQVLELRGLGAFTRQRRQDRSLPLLSRPPYSHNADTPARQTRRAPPPRRGDPRTPPAHVAGKPHANSDRSAWAPPRSEASEPRLLWCPRIRRRESASRASHPSASRIMNATMTATARAHA